MAKVTRDTLPRGAELLKEHVFTPMTDMATALSGNVVQEQMEGSKGTFRLNLSIPYISSRYFWANPGGWFYVPFCLPPLQENFDSNIAVGPNVPVPVLTEVGFSFDQKSEPAMITDVWSGKAFDVAKPPPEAFFVSNYNEGNACYQRAGSVSIKLAIFEKSQHFFVPQTVGSGSGTSAKPTLGAQSEVFTATLGPALIGATAARENPVAYHGLSAPIDPKKTYMFAINADELYDSANNLHTALVSVQATLKFKMELVTRDASSADTPQAVQNIPDETLPTSYGIRTADSVSIGVPSAGAAVEADGTNGVNTNLEKIDEKLRHKIQGGYGDFSATHVKQQVQDDAGYEIIAVPMFGNEALGELLARPTWLHVRDSEETYTDRAIIPVTSPMTIHHVFVTNNFLTATPRSTGSSAYPAPPVASRLMYKVGVGIVDGALSDDVDYTQVAYGEITPDAADSALMVDFMDLQNQATLQKDTTRPQRWEQAIFSVPIRLGTTAGTGYHAQGAPFFVGEGGKHGINTTPRTLVGNGSGSDAAAATDGREQLIEVRMQINPRGSVFNTSRAWQSYVADWAIFSGYGGSWVYIVGKKHMRS
jgi:hypothetical protein